MSFEEEGEAAEGDWEYDGDDYEVVEMENLTHTIYTYGDYTDEPAYDVLSSTAAPNSTAGEPQNFIEFKVAQTLWVYVGAAIIAVGTIGHVMSALVLLGSKRMRLLSLTVYLVATSLAGLAALYVGLLRQVVLHESNWAIDVRDHVSDAGCRVHAVLTYMTLQLYLWLQATIAVERTIAVLRPLHYKRWCTWRRNLIVVASIVVLLGLFNAIVAFVYRIDPLNGYCTESPDEKELFQIVWGHVDLVLYSIFPTAIIIPCNVMTLMAVYRSQADSHSHARKYVQLTVMLVVHNCVCVATTLPISVIFLVPWPTERYSPENARRELEWTVFSLLQYLGTTSSFLVYCTSAQRFRHAIADLFSGGFNASKTSTTSVTSSRQNSSSGSRTSRLRLQSLARNAAASAGVSAGADGEGIAKGSSGSGGGSGSGGEAGGVAAEHEHAC